jgi:hypothetical protein
VTLAQVATKAVEVCSLSGDSEQLDELLQRFEDSDEPIRAIGEIGELVADAIRVIAGAEPEPELQMAGAVIVYLAYRRDELHAEPAELLKLAARAEFDAHPPPAVADWLTDQGVDLR